MHDMSNSVSLNAYNAELSLKRSWRGPKSQEIGEEGGLYLTLHCNQENDSVCIKMVMQR